MHSDLDGSFSPSHSPLSPFPMQPLNNLSINNQQTHTQSNNSPSTSPSSLNRPIFRALIVQDSSSSHPPAVRDDAYYSWSTQSDRTMKNIELNLHSTNSSPFTSTTSSTTASCQTSPAQTFSTLISLPPCPSIPFTPPPPPVYLEPSCFPCKTSPHTWYEIITALKCMNGMKLEQRPYSLICTIRSPFTFLRFRVYIYHSIGSDSLLEVQRREGCSVAFNRVVKRIKHILEQAAHAHDDIIWQTSHQLSLHPINTRNHSDDHASFHYSSSSTSHIPAPFKALSLSALDPVTIQNLADCHVLKEVLECS